MFAGDVVCERRKYGAAYIPELSSGRPQITSCENPAGQITFAGGYHSLISYRSRQKNTILLLP